ncbi:4-hydroxy-tetrahydrodipicolinate synthase [Acidiferrobacter sp.]|uniref:4-hydroxy-tetrahydrodipicolinate synthase n=1 Tax=Acidiferrobacter sp. TaxID=1872107 RepID=UPI002617AA2D|nr:4-hydroxy-tetrahydrodipicolinate synthase [Acidiferrobacter sp.]
MLRGSLVALVTPMRDDGAVDFAALDRLIDFHLEAGTHGIVAVGTTGEASTLDVDEHVAVIAHVVRAVSGRIPVIAGTGANATSEAIALSRAAAEAGATACLVVTPYYNKPTQEGLFRHFGAIAGAIDRPVILYNVPSRTACDLLPETVARLALVPGIVGIKEATGNLDRARAIAAACPPDFALYGGDDATGVALGGLGARGVISVTANVAPRAMSAIWEAILAGDHEAARQKDRALAGLHQALFVESNPIPVKWALHAMGLIGPHLRLPLTPLSENRQPAVRDALQQAGITL